MIIKKLFMVMSMSCAISIYSFPQYDYSISCKHYEDLLEREVLDLVAEGTISNGYEVILFNSCKQWKKNQEELAVERDFQFSPIPEDLHVRPE
ncbi:MAG: hypothetical protein ACXWL2_03715 [Candidatus Chromulinivorax sp.]